jgi:hypothetical protein
VDEEGLGEVIKEAFLDNDRNLTARSAVEWAGGYVIPAEAIATDELMLQMAGGDLVELARGSLDKLAGDRLSAARIRGLRPDNPEINRLLDLAAGMQVPVPEGFAPNTTYRTHFPLSRHYTTVATACCKMFMDYRESGLAVVVSMETARRIPGAHFSEPSWTTKKGKASGRPITDLSAERWGAALNSEYAVNWARERWGDIRHPDIHSIVRMAYRVFDRISAAHPSTSWADMVLFKMDLKGAYTLLSFRPEDVPLIGIPLSDAVVMFIICGIFGWSCTPFAFQVVTRAIVFEVNHLITGEAEMYVDDLIGVTVQWALLADLALADGVCTGLLGPKAVEKSKTEGGRRLDILGWVLDLNRMLVAVARKNFLKALYGFCTIGAEGRYHVTDMERLASWSTRYGLVFRCMKPLSAHLYSATLGRRSRQRTHQVPPGARTAMDMWLAVLCLGDLSEEHLCLPMHTLSGAATAIGFQFDASLSGAGILWYQYDPTSGSGANLGVHPLLGGASVSLLEFGFGGDASFQNCAEFMAMLLGIMGCALLGYKGQGIRITGDSTTALKWARAEYTKSAAARNASIVYVQLCTAMDVWVETTEFVAGVENIQCDGLSRGATLEDVLSPSERLGITHDLADFHTVDAVRRLLTLCDPRRDTEGAEQFGSFLREVREGVNNLLAAQGASRC